MAEAVENAPTPERAKGRSAELAQAACEASHLTDKLLPLERASGTDMRLSGRVLDFQQLIRQVGDAYVASVVAGHEDVIYDMPTEQVLIRGEAIIRHEAILNLLIKVATHGGPDLSKITLTLRCEGEQAVLTVTDDGVGIPANKHIDAINLFSQAGRGAGQWVGVANCRAGNGKPCWLAGGF
ncbi:ATP-binding protein [Tateyamaria sp.]|uniref:sensor histidine kinase n=1 Tax=Tateyamaria sp. TaxID=1929288 RepID=UPI00329FD392